MWASQPLRTVVTVGLSSNNTAGRLLREISWGRSSPRRPQAGTARRATATKAGTTGRGSSAPNDTMSVLHQRQLDDEPGAGTEVVAILDPHPAPVQLDVFLDEGEPQAHAAVAGPVAALAAPGEPVEDDLPFLLGHPVALVLDGDAH